jgi:head-tail adaptor
MPRAGRMNKYVALSRCPQTTPDSDGFFDALSPEYAWASIEPLEPIAADGTRVTAYRVVMRYHPQVTMDTRIVYGTRELFVKGVQNVAERGSDMVLYCEEVTP